ncbi:hypothetical protein Poly51_43600 [Rubripirellula tenax]|uniref:SGNH hydrolase-type esterase domain-containing protein n=1 Tax=Rubripirellula tenax TaxID=2528015 RepID=A0A5C6ETY5_9BACT|nr:GDSL-type esterase/lipase family protein [Rubripirellula tenax]TWU51066.1 hypothetical protein Poly51_43600 [Rubripirellula tenax]
MIFRLGLVLSTFWISVFWISVVAIAQVDEPYRSRAIEKWEDEIRKLESLDSSETDPADAVLLLGSSSIRRWTQAAIDLAPYRVVRRGYGGAKYSDLAVFAERLIQPHQYRAVVMFVGNDISGDAHDHTVDQVDGWVRHIVDVSRKHQSGSPVLIVEVTPTGKRFEHWSAIRRLNAQLREIALSTPMVYFVPTAASFLDPDGNPRSELFVDDRLHLNDQGYVIWAELIRDQLDDVLRLIESTREAKSK